MENGLLLATNALAIEISVASASSAMAPTQAKQAAAPVVETALALGMLGWWSAGAVGDGRGELSVAGRPLTKERRASSSGG